MTFTEAGESYGKDRCKPQIFFLLDYFTLRAASLRERVETASVQTQQAKNVCVCVTESIPVCPAFLRPACV